MTHEAFVISYLCGAMSLNSFGDDRSIIGVLWLSLCAGWAIVGINRSLA